MSVWPKTAAPAPSLSGVEGALVSISIDVEARRLESLLDSLARVSFPINPEIYHDAAVVYRYPDGRLETQATTLVEFPAYAGQLDEVRRALAGNGFGPAAFHVTSMLDEIHSGAPAETAPEGAGYVERYRVKRRTAADR